MGASCRQQESNQRNLYLQPPWLHIDRKLGWKLRWNLNPATPTLAVGIPSTVLICWTTTSAPSSSYWSFKFKWKIHSKPTFGLSVSAQVTELDNAELSWGRSRNSKSIFLGFQGLPNFFQDVLTLLVWFFLNHIKVSVKTRHCLFSAEKKMNKLVLYAFMPH